MRCKFCGDVGYAQSLGGADVCPACDCGQFHHHGLAYRRLVGRAPTPTTNERRGEWPPEQAWRALIGN